MGGFPILKRWSMIWALPKIEELRKTEVTKATPRTKPLTLDCQICVFFCFLMFSGPSHLVVTADILMVEKKFQAKSLSRHRNVKFNFISLQMMVGWVEKNMLCFCVMVSSKFRHILGIHDHQFIENEVDPAFKDQSILIPAHSWMSLTHTSATRSRTDLQELVSLLQIPQCLNDQTGRWF